VKLYEINEAVRTLCEQGIVEDQDTGEILFEGPEGLETLEMERSAKLLAIAKVIKEQTAELDAYEVERKALAKRMMARGAAMEKRIEWLKGYLVDNTTPEEKVKDGTISLSFRTTESIEYDGDAFELPEDLRIEKHSFQPNREAIKAVLKAGDAVRGAFLVTRVSPSIR
jgi:hypothetical protein